jgi:hypothetical protein
VKIAPQISKVMAFKGQLPIKSKMSIGNILFENVMNAELHKKDMY